MKKTLLILFTFLSLSAFCQLNNGDFENWSTDMSSANIPQGWSTSGFGADSTHDAAQGNSALVVWTWYTYAIGYANNGPTAGAFNFVNAGTPFTMKPTHLMGVYKFDTTNVLTKDSAFIAVLLKRHNTSTNQRDTVGLGIGLLPAANVYTPFTVPIIDLMPGISPDSIVVIISSQRTIWDMGTATNTCTSSANDCAYLYVDDLALALISGTIEISDLFNNEAYPNPTSDYISFKYKTITNGSDETLTVFDNTGKNCYSGKINNNSNNLNIKNFESGVYYYTISSDDKTIVSKGKFAVVN